MTQRVHRFGRAGHLIGLSVAPTQLVAALPGRGGSVTTRTWALEPMQRADDSWPSLAAAFAELRDATSPSVQTVAIALSPPLVQLRRVELPTLRAAKLRLFLSRNAARYFPQVSEPQLANGTPLARSSPAPYLTACAPARIVAAILRAAQESGLSVQTIVPAHAAWASAARRRWSAVRRTGGDVAVHLPTHIELLTLDDGRFVGIRRLVASVGTQEGAHDEAHHDASNVAGEHATYILDHPDAAAATHAGATHGPELLPESVYRTRATRRHRWIAAGSGAVAAALLLMAVGTLWRAHRTLDEVTRQRAALRTPVTRVTAGEQRVSTVQAALRAVQRIERAAPLWSDVISDVADNLPTDASLVALRAHGDSVAASGIAAHGAAVFERMSGAKILDNVQSAAPIRHEAKRGVAPIDQFTFTAHIPDAAPLYLPTKMVQ